MVVLCVCPALCPALPSPWLMGAGQLLDPRWIRFLLQVIWNWAWETVSRHGFTHNMQNLEFGAASFCHVKEDSLEREKSWANTSRGETEGFVVHSSGPFLRPGQVPCDIALLSCVSFLPFRLVIKVRSTVCSQIPKAWAMGWASPALGSSRRTPSKAD